MKVAFDHLGWLNSYYVAFNNNLTLGLGVRYWV